MGRLVYNKAVRHKSRAPSNQRPTDRWTDRVAYRLACTRLKMTVYSRGLLVSTNFDRVFCCFEACRHFLVACALLVGWSIGQLVGMSIGLLVADCSGHATYGNRTCFLQHQYHMLFNLPISHTGTPAASPAEIPIASPAASHAASYAHKFFTKK